MGVNPSLLVGSTSETTLYTQDLRSSHLNFINTELSTMSTYGDLTTEVVSFNLHITRSYNNTTFPSYFSDLSLCTQNRNSAGDSFPFLLLVA